MSSAASNLGMAGHRIAACSWTLQTSDHLIPSAQLERLQVAANANAVQATGLAGDAAGGAAGAVAELLPTLRAPWSTQPLQQPWGRVSCVCCCSGHNTSSCKGIMSLSGGAKMGYNKAALADKAASGPGAQVLHDVSFGAMHMAWPEPRKHAAAGAEEAATKASKAKKAKAGYDSDEDPWHQYLAEDMVPVSPLSPGKVWLRKQESDHMALV